MQYFTNSALQIVTKKKKKKPNFEYKKLSIQNLEFYFKSYYFSSLAFFTFCSVNAKAKTSLISFT
jgi:hypothetical protein